MRCRAGVTRMCRPVGLGRTGVVIPERILTKAPTAELKANQTDQDSLPPYEALDDILRCLVEQEMPLAAVIARGHAAETVKKIERLLYLAEYKRRQAAPGVKISAKRISAATGAIRSPINSGRMSPARLPRYRRRSTSALRPPTAATPLKAR